MAPPIRLRTRLWLGGLAAGGVAIAHVVAFVLAAPDPHERELLLEATGHGTWPLIVSLAMGAAVAALARFGVSRLRGEPSSSSSVRYHATAGRLLLLQVVGFLLLEGLERLATGHGLAGFLVEPVILIGVLAQLPVALAGAGLLVTLVRLVDRLVLLRTSLPPFRATTHRGVLDVPVPRTRVAADPANPRGPPS
jgi:hypothetical protein